MKNKNSILNLAFLLFALSIFSQEKHYTNSHTFVPLKYFKEYYVQKDSLGFLTRKGDTLIKVKNFKKPKGVGVVYEPKDSTFLEVYKKLAFQPKENKSDGTNPMKYWKKEIKIYFTDNISRKVKKELVKFTKTIENDIDSLNISTVKNFNEANYIIYTDKDYDYQSKISNATSASYYVNWNNRNQITKGFIKLNTIALFSEILQIQKAKEVFIFSLGWFKSSKDLSCDSYFSNCFSENKRLGELDMEILKYHYSYGICKGTNLSDFEEQHKRAKESLKNPRNKYVIYHQD